ncbi:phage terminase small subunit P27 family [Latilactobacillus curvatus]|uniref:phage terminase small subunit P27 family n=1 Tax=Latilactobacillus curvatus TaxID=28038 RepID=UPI00223B802F|nr:phage terminase small subunit P27 family [Latilactobacillus curvatus]MCS8582382.1 phage terminase small subunit P27 family [Latilactobacillus curvatus]MCS8607008.1 phage terminase small subunit P27 family [Latilactobacillus curvatus]MCS8617092.1 phage terminase small subunit P27 family [Latilactobacillus curvatus]
MAGRKPKLTTDKNDRKDQRDRTAELIENQSGFRKLQKSPPKYLEGKAAWMYKTIYSELEHSGQLEVIKQLDLNLVSVFCINYELLRTAYDDVRENGQTKMAFKTVVNPVTGDVIAHDFTGFKQNPNVKIIDMATKNIKALSIELGFSPTSRATLMKVIKPDKEGASMEEIAKMFGGKQSEG